MAISTDTAKGWYPGADRIGVPASNYVVGNYARKAVCIHTMAGHMAGTIAYFTDPARRVSAHFAIDPAGHVKQFVSTIDTAYANGLSWSDRHRCWIDPEGHLLKTPHPAPRWPGLSAPTNPNLTTISIELDGYPSDPIPAPMYASLVALLRWLSVTFSVTLGAYTVGKNMIGHRDISPVARPSCPGPRVDFDALAGAANIPPPDPLKTHALAGIEHPHYCGSGFFSFYTTRGGLGLFGYPLTDEAADTDALDQPCTWMRMERGVMKYRDGEGVHLALLVESVTKGWIV